MSEEEGEFWDRLERYRVRRSITWSKFVYSDVRANKQDIMREGLYKFNVLIRSFAVYHEPPQGQQGLTKQEKENFYFEGGRKCFRKEGNQKEIGCSDNEKHLIPIKLV